MVVGNTFVCGRVPGSTVGVGEGGAEGEDDAAEGEDAEAGTAGEADDPEEAAAPDEPPAAPDEPPAAPDEATDAACGLDDPPHPAPAAATTMAVATAPSTLRVLTEGIRTQPFSSTSHRRS
ncbi:hypothetical protein GCM10009839_17370 [Catenulispora yoronensis]|uniref:Uncharacterized protein n=1 Tax=Catenulispora yoronensis TaxID=450799 RepID=A0ABN2TTH3_9ACTN